MASNRKKQDEKHLKILRKLVSLPGNKQCFDCNQRGPTYVNVTIGSFVCTTCSGSLRGLTPPHRVKSISMAVFTPEEIEMLQARGNEYCRKVWLALYDSNNIQDTKDEHLVRDFMVAKYEKKRYYMEPSVALKNGNSSSAGQSSICGAGADSSKIQHSVPNSSLTTSPPVVPAPVPNSRLHQSNAFGSSMPGFSLPDPFGLATNHTQRQKNQTQQQQQQQQQQQLQPPPQAQEQSFANFDNNPIFNSSALTSSTSFPLLKPNTALEDKYAALKDLDCLMKMQQETSQTQGTQANGWSSSGTDKGPSLNPFQTDIGNNNVFNPFRSGLIQQAEKNGNINNSFSNSSSSINNSSSSNTTNANNPWKTTNPWTTNPLPMSQSMPFPSTNWNGKGNITVIPGNSNNPFL